MIKPREHGGILPPRLALHGQLCQVDQALRDAPLCRARIQPFQSPPEGRHVLSPVLPHSPDLADVFRAFPQTVEPLLNYHDILLRGPSPLSVAQRELIAAFVSGLNACEFCLGAHTIIAETFGVPPKLIEQMVSDLDSAPIEPDFRVVLDLVRKLTLTPAHVREADRAAVRKAGWSEQALHDAVAVTALFNFMNRLVDGMGVKTSPAIQAAQRERHQQAEAPSSQPYQDYGRRIGVIDD